MFKIADRVKETTITNGSGNSIYLSGSFGGYNTFLHGIGDGNSTFYTIENNSQFEVGIGTYSASSNSLSRDTILNSSNNNNKIILEGLSIVICTYPAQKAVFLNENGYISALNYAGILFPDNTIQNTANNPQSKSYINITTSTTLESLYNVIFAKCDSSPINITLPNASGIGGTEILIKKIGQNLLTIYPQVDQYIDNKPEISIFHTHEAMSLISDNENWYIF